MTNEKVLREECRKDRLLQAAATIYAAQSNLKLSYAVKLAFLLEEHLECDLVEQEKRLGGN